MYEKNQGKGEASMEGHQYSVDTLESPLAGCSAPPGLKIISWTQGQKCILTLVLSGTAHIVRHPTHRTEEGGQVSTGHLEAHKVLQVGTSRQWLLGRPGL